MGIGIHSGLVALGLCRGKGAEGNEHCGVDDLSVEEASASDFLKANDFGLVWQRCHWVW